MIYKPFFHTCRDNGNCNLKNKQHHNTEIDIKK